MHWAAMSRFRAFKRKIILTTFHGVYKITTIPDKTSNICCSLNGLDFSERILVMVDPLVIFVLSYELVMNCKFNDYNQIYDLFF